MAEPEITIGTERVFTGKRFSVRVDRVRLADGSESTRDIVEAPNAVVVVAVDDEGHVLMVRQYRKAPERELLELPAGVIDPGETPFESAQRELREEVGMAAGRLTELGSFFAAPGGLTECVYAFLATELRADPLPPDEDERIEVERAPFRDLMERAIRRAP